MMDLEVEHGVDRANGADELMSRLLFISDAASRITTAERQLAGALATVRQVVGELAALVELTPWRLLRTDQLLPGMEVVHDGDWWQVQAIAAHDPASQWIDFGAFRLERPGNHSWMCRETRAVEIADLRVGDVLAYRQAVTWATVTSVDVATTIDPTTKEPAVDVALRFGDGRTMEWKTFGYGEVAVALPRPSAAG
jgi:hypothetical protein